MTGNSIMKRIIDIVLINQEKKTACIAVFINCLLMSNNAL